MDKSFSEVAGKSGRADLIRPANLIALSPLLKADSITSLHSHLRGNSKEDEHEKTVITCSIDTFNDC